jgi:hypothetical protein
MSILQAPPLVGNIINSPPEDAQRVVSWRKTLLLHRSVFLTAWHRCFPEHSCIDLRLNWEISIPSGWDEEGWRRAAHAYHEDRKRSGRR